MSNKITTDLLEFIENSPELLSCSADYERDSDKTWI